MVIIGTVSLVSAVLTNLLPESRDTELPQTMNEAFKQKQQQDNDGKIYIELSQKWDTTQT